MFSSNNLQQKTIAASVEFTGYGLHTGKTAKVILHPAQANSGILFRQIDAKGCSTEITAHWQHTKELPLCTCLVAENGVQVRTVEHLLAGFYACDIDNALVEVFGNELPIFDGSAYPFVKQIDQAGTTVLPQTRKMIQVLKTIRIEENERYVQIEPADNFSVDLSIELAKFGLSRWQGEITPEIFKDQIVMARTFGRLKNGIIAKLGTFFRKDPVCLGANLSSALVLLSGNVLNKGGLRMPDEFVKHRVLDLMGDMMLAEAGLVGKISGFSTAHRLNQQLLAKLLSDKSAWRWQT